MGYQPDLKEIQAEAKRFIDANVWDGGDKGWVTARWAKHTDEELQELIDDMLEYLSDENMI